MSKGLFRSRDGGATWDTLEDGASNVREFTAIALSPALPLDKTLFVRTWSSGPSPSATFCSLRRSTDGGQTWTELLKSSSGYYGCMGAVVSPRFAEDRVVVINGSVSRDSGATVGGGPPIPQLGAGRAVFTPDGWLYMPSYTNGVWRHAPFPVQIGP